jgi:hypothetical protein
MQPPNNFRAIGGFKKQLDSLAKVFASILDIVTLARNVELGAQCNETVVFSANDGGQVGCGIHKF